MEGWGLLRRGSFRFDTWPFQSGGLVGTFDFDGHVAGKPGWLLLILVGTVRCGDEALMEVLWSSCCLDLTL